MVPLREPRRRPRHRILLSRPRWIFATLYGLAVAATVLAPLKPDLFWDTLLARFGVLYSARLEQVLDFAANALLFAPIGFLLHGWWRGTGGASRRSALGALATAACLATAIELLQAGLGWRTASVQDVLANVAGAAMGLWIDRFLARRPPGIP